MQKLKNIIQVEGLGHQWPPQVTAGLRRIEPGSPIAGIDVGEDYLDLAILDGAGATLTYRRVALIGIDRDPLGALRERIARAAPELGRGALAIVDSPRWPRDRALGHGRARAGRRGRDLDLALRRLVAALAAVWPALGRLAMYPTPRAAYFAACIADPRCKPHLRALGRALFAAHPRRERRPAACAAPPPRGGMLFTRFMIAGFAAYRALEAAGVETCESFPDLQFRLSAPTRVLLKKGAGKTALAMRQWIVARRARSAGIAAAAPATLDFADAAVLALAARCASVSNTLIEMRSAAEGGFVLALDPAEAETAAAVFERRRDCTRNEKMGCFPGRDLDDRMTSP